MTSPAGNGRVKKICYFPLPVAPVSGNSHFCVERKQGGGRKELRGMKDMLVESVR